MCGLFQSLAEVRQCQPTKRLPDTARGAAPHLRPHQTKRHEVATVFVAVLSPFFSSIWVCPAKIDFVFECSIYKGNSFAAVKYSGLPVVCFSRALCILYEYWAYYICLSYFDLPACWLFRLTLSSFRVENLPVTPPPHAPFVFAFLRLTRTSLEQVGQSTQSDGPLARAEESHLELLLGEQVIL